jgi:hypothetical protein
MAWSKNDEKWLSANYPSLKVVGGIVKGELRFLATWDGKELHIGEKSSSRKGVNLLCRYNIAIDGTSVCEVSGKIDSVARSLDKGPMDLHKNPDGTLCLAGYYSLKKMASGDMMALENFMNHYIVPFFYAQKFYEIYNHWPWGELSHGVLGLIEDYIESQHCEESGLVQLVRSINKVYSSEDPKIIDKIFSQKYGGNRTCPFCPSTKKLCECHPNAMSSIWTVRKERRYYRLKIDYLKRL